MAGIATQFTIQDRMTSRLNTMINASERLNRTLEDNNAVSEAAEKQMSRSAQAMSLAWTIMAETGMSKSEAMKAAWDQVGRNVKNAGYKVETFHQKQQKAADGAKGVKDAWSRVSGYIKSAMTAIGVKKTIELADSMTTTRARLDLMNDGLQTTEELQRMIMKSANRSRASYLSTADAVSKMGIMAKDAFSSNEELIEFSELINKQFTIAGTEAGGIDAAMLQLTQAMSSGVLRGEELNSIFEQAPTIIQTIADYLGVPIGKIREMAAEGQITSTVVKNAMLASADEINAKFEQMPMTFSQVWTIAKNVALEAFTPVLTLIGQGAQWIYDNWSTIAPVFWGLAGAAIAYATALGIQAAVTWIANGAAKAFFVTLLSNPLFWIAMAIGIVIGVLYKMIQAVGGVKNAWEICKAALLVAWAAIKVAFFAVYNWFANIIDKLKLCWMRCGVAIADFMGDTKAKVLMLLQNLVNGAIDIINKFIGILNKIPGVNINAVEHVTFGATAAAENEAAKQARADALNQYEADINAARAERDAKYANAKQELADATTKLSETYANARAEAAQNPSDAGAEEPWSAYENGPGNISNVGRVDSVGSVDEDVNIAEEDLKFLRDVAEMRYVQNFVTLTPTVAVDARISEKVDVDDVVSQIERKLEDEFAATAERVYE